MLSLPRREALYTEVSSDSSESSKGEVVAVPAVRNGYSMSVPENRRVMRGGTEGEWVWEVIRPEEMAKWPEPPIGTEALATMKQPVTLVWKAVEGVNIPWVLVAESARLRSKGKRSRGSEAEMGLYAWREFERGEVIGTYSGKSSAIYSVYEIKEIKKVYEEMKAAAAHGDMILEIEVSPTEIKLVDGEGAGPPYLQRANDGSGSNTVYMDVGGTMRSMRKGAERGRGTRWGVRTRGGGWQQLERREITWAYGKAYWAERGEREKDGERGEKEEDEERGPGEGNSEGRGEGEASENEERLNGTMWCEIGRARALCRAESTQKVGVMYVTEGWVRKDERKKGWMRRALGTELKRRIQVEEVHLIAREGEAEAAWEGMGFTRASEEQVKGEQVAYTPRSGEVYMKAKRTWVLQIAENASANGAVAPQGRLIRREKCRQKGGEWYEADAVQEVKGWHREGRGEEGWDVRNTIPGEAKSAAEGREEVAVFMIGPGRHECEASRPGSRLRARSRQGGREGASSRASSEGTSRPGSRQRAGRWRDEGQPDREPRPDNEQKTEDERDRREGGNRKEEDEEASREKGDSTEHIASEGANGESGTEARNKDGQGNDGWRSVPGGPFTAKLMARSRQPVPNATYRNYSVTVPIDPIRGNIYPGGDIRFLTVPGAPAEGVVYPLPRSWGAEMNKLTFKLKLSKAGATADTVNVASALYREPSEEPAQEEGTGERSGEGKQEGEEGDGGEEGQKEETGKTRREERIEGGDKGREGRVTEAEDSSRGEADEGEGERRAHEGDGRRADRRHKPQHMATTARNDARAEGNDKEERARGTEVGSEGKRSGTADEQEAGQNNSEEDEERSTRGPEDATKGDGGPQDDKKEEEREKTKKQGWAMTYNCCGLRMQGRRTQGRRVGRGWGTGTDLQARPTDKTSRILGELQEGRVEIAVLTDTHAEGEELDALKGHLKGRGWDVEATEGGREGRGARGGVLVMWDATMWQRAGRNATETVVQGRVVRVKLKSMQGKERVTVVGVYAQCRGGKQGEDKCQPRKADARKKQEDAEQQQHEEDDMWGEIDDAIAGDDNVMMMGDMNAEMWEALQRAGRKSGVQDRRLIEVAERHRLTHMSVGRATYRETSEIDHILVTTHIRQMVSEPEWRPGQREGDHGAVWAKLNTVEDEEGRGQERPKGPKMNKMGKGEWEAYRVRAEEYAEDAVRGVEGAKERIRARQEAMTRAVQEIVKEKEEKEGATKRESTVRNAGPRDDGDEGRDASGQEVEEEREQGEQEATRGGGQEEMEEGADSHRWQEEWPSEEGEEERMMREIEEWQGYDKEAEETEMSGEERKGTGDGGEEREKEEKKQRKGETHRTEEIERAVEGEATQQARPQTQGEEKGRQANKAEEEEEAEKIVVTARDGNMRIAGYAGKDGLREWLEEQGYREQQGEDGGRCMTAELGDGTSAAVANEMKRWGEVVVGSLEGDEDAEEDEEIEEMLRAVEKEKEEAERAAANKGERERAADSDRQSTGRKGRNESNNEFKPTMEGKSLRGQPEGEAGGGLGKKGNGKGREKGAEREREGRGGRLHREMARWVRIRAAVEGWQGGRNEREWKVFGSDAKWVGAQTWARKAATLPTKRERQESARRDVRNKAEGAIREWAAYARGWEGDKVIQAVAEAVAAKGTGPGSKGGVYREMHRILSAKGEVRGDQRLKSVYKGSDKKGEEIKGAARVREECREQGKKINSARPVAAKVVAQIMEWINEEGGERERGEITEEAEEGDWVDNVCAWGRFKQGLARTAEVKGVGVDGFNAYLLRNATEVVQEAYWRDLKEVIRTRDFPDEWRERIAMLAMKPDEDPADLSRRRDLWLECHGSKLAMWMLGAEYDEAAAWAIPGSQAGAVKGRGCPEQSLVMRCQKEQCAVERTLCCRAYLDFGVFFMSCVREVQWEVEKWSKVKIGVTEAVRALYTGLRGKYETAYGMTEAFELENGNAQGCSQSPNRSKFQLRMVQEAVRIMCEGFEFRGAKEKVPQMWFVDDGAFVAGNLATLQLILDTCWMVTRAAGLKIMIKGVKKTAWQAAYWEGEEERHVEGWQMRLPDGRIVPQVRGEEQDGAKRKENYEEGKARKASGQTARGEYTYLGTSEAEKWGRAQEGVRKKVIGFCSNILRLIGRVGQLDGEQTRVVMEAGVEGSASFYARSTAIGWEACEEVEQVRAEVLRGNGIASGAARAQIYATREAGGLGHIHAYQSTAAALTDQIEKTLQSDPGTPANIALRAHIRATYIRLGWTERESMVEWYPKHLENILSEEMVVEAWLQSRLRAGVRMREVGEDKGGDRKQQTNGDPGERERGPPIWEADARSEWKGGGDGPCRVRVGRGANRQAVLRVWVVEGTEGGGGSALKKFEEMVIAQGGDVDLCRNLDSYPAAKLSHTVAAATGGFVGKIDTLAVGLTACLLGAGREKVEDGVDPTAGILLHKKLGDQVMAGEATTTMIIIKLVNKTHR